MSTTPIWNGAVWRDTGKPRDALTPAERDLVEYTRTIDWREDVDPWELVKIIDRLAPKPPPTPPAAEAAA